MSEYFKSINPDEGSKDKSPELAENYWSRKPENLIPGEIVHPVLYSTLAMEAGTRKLYINGSDEFDAQAGEPDNYYGRFALMRVYQSTGEDTPAIDGFIADIRMIGQSEVPTRVMPGDDDEDNDYPEFSNPLPILGNIYMDVEQNVAYRGDERLLDAAEYLARTIDELFDFTDNEEDALDLAVPVDALTIPKHAKFEEPSGEEPEDTEQPPEPPRHRREP